MVVLFFFLTWTPHLFPVWRANIGWTNKGNLKFNPNAALSKIDLGSNTAILYAFEVYQLDWFCELWAACWSYSKVCRHRQGFLHCVQVWRYIRRRAASCFRAAAKDHPRCSSTTGTTAQCYWGMLFKLVCLLMIVDTIVLVSAFSLPCPSVILLFKWFSNKDFLISGQIL